MTDRELLSAVSDFIRKRVKAVPVDIFQLCSDLSVKTIPLSKMVSDGFKAANVFGYWGNEDGTSTLHNGQGIIAYNDFKPLNRVRFTLAEELMHLFLKHLEDQRFNMFSQSFDEQTYLRYEYEAKLAAGMILCPPRFYFTFRSELTPYALSRVCDVSEACAYRIIEDYARNMEVLIHLPTYAFSVTPRYDHKEMWSYRALMHKEPYEMLELWSNDH